MHGPLQEIGLAEVLQLLGRGARSGELEVVGADPTAPRRVRLRGGRIVALEPDAGDEAVDGALVARHLLVRDANRLEVPESVREGTRRALAMRALATMLHWGRGRFDFREAEGDIPSGPIDITVDAVLLALVESESRRVELDTVLDHFHAVPTVAAAERMDAGEVIALDLLDWRILDAVDGRRDISAIAGMVDEPLESVGERIRRLEEAAILELSAPSVDDVLAARGAIEAGRYDDAVTRLEGRVQRAREDHEAWRLLGLAEVGAGRFDRAIAAWEAWQQAEPALAQEAAALIGAARTMLEALREHRD